MTKRIAAALAEAEGMEAALPGTPSFDVSEKAAEKIEEFCVRRGAGRPFDPVKWLKLNHPEDPLRGAGIRIVVGMAKEVRYMPAMGLNNLLIIL